MSDIALSVRNLTKQYRILHNAERHNRVTDAVASSVKGLFRKSEVETFKALDDVSFDVKKGEVLGIIGRNGAGKSTLLKVLSRITEPTSGEVHVYGRVGSLLEVGTGFHPELTGQENIYLNGAILGMKKREIDRQFDAIVDFAEVEKFLDTPVKRYSSGMYVRLAFAVAAHLNPEILIVDEVLAVGDAQFQKKCLGKMQDVSRQQGRTVLFVSHNMAAVRSLCSSCVLFASGQLMSAGKPDQVISSYTSRLQESGGILDQFRIINKGIELEQVLINGEATTHVHIQPLDNHLRLHLVGNALHNLQGSLEVTLTDLNGFPLAYYGEGHLAGKSDMLKAGTFSWDADIWLPSHINSGLYSLTIDIAHHNVQYWIRGEQAIQLDCEGTPTATGQPMQYNDQKGLLRLEGSINRNTVPDFISA